MAEYYIRDHQNYSFLEENNNNLSSFIQFNTTTTTTTTAKPNGLVNTYAYENVDSRFQMMERIKVKNTATSYRESISSMYESNSLSDLYFDQSNIQQIQDKIQSAVKEKTQESFQPFMNINDIKTIMRKHYLEYAKDVLYLEDNSTNQQLQYLNQKVLDHCIPLVYNESLAYVKFIRDQNYIATPIMHPLQPDRVYNDLEYNRFL